MIDYRIRIQSAAAHRYAVTLTIPEPQAEQIVSLPVWIPGSYMVREFGRHLSAFEARQGRQARGVEPLDKTTWRVRCEGRAALVLSYEVYAFDTSVRTAYLDIKRGFFNGTSVCLRVHGGEALPHRLRLEGLPRGWQVATAMAADADAGKRRYIAQGYDELVDHPFELGTFWHGQFTAAGIVHEWVVAGALPSFDGQRLLADARRICEAEIAFWHGDGAKAGKRGARGRPAACGVPFDRYVFMLNAVEDGYGGLEHRASTALIASRRDLPRRGVAPSGDGYVTLLGLISHEYFHSWNVKRLKPIELAQIDFTRENYTQLLWFFEGFTSYYDDLLLLRSGLIDAPRYLKLLARTLSGVAAMPGRRVQSVAQASFDAWVKYYRGDENTPNATVSYYTKGSLVALCLDLTLRLHGQGTLDDVMRRLWAASAGGPVSEADIFAAADAIAGRRVSRELQAWVHGRGDLPVAALLQRLGVRCTQEQAGFAARLGLKLSEGPVTGIQVRSVLRDSVAERAGLSAGDEILAADGWRVRRLEDALAWVDLAAGFDLLLVRDQRIVSLRVHALDAQAAKADGAVTFRLDIEATPVHPAAAVRDAWLARADIAAPVR